MMHVSTFQAIVERQLRKRYEIPQHYEIDETENAQHVGNA